MTLKKADLILHPVRLRIITLLAGNEKMTPQQIAGELPDIPQATLYRQLATLAKGGILEVENHRQVRGAVEKIYSLPGDSAVLGQADLKDTSSEEHMRMFAAFLATMLDDYGRYLAQETYDHYADGVSYRKISLQLDEEEHIELLQQIRKLIEQANTRSRESKRSRRLRNFTVVSLPEPDKPSLGD